MQERNNWVAGALLVALGVFGSAGDLKMDLKLGGGPIVGSVGNQYFRGVYHLAAEAALPLGRGELLGSAQYRIFRGKTYDATQYGVGYAMNTAGQVVTGQITPYVLGSDGLPKPDGRYDSVDLRRDNLEGLTFGFGYRMPVLAEGLAFHCGINLNFLRAQQDVTGGIKVVQNRNVTTPVVLGQENFYTQFQKTTLKPGAFAGLRYNLTSEFFLQADLNVLGYREINYRPFSYTGQAATTEFKDRTKTVLEFSIGMNF
jgi:hypothetical protein